MLDVLPRQCSLLKINTISAIKNKPSLLLFFCDNALTHSLLSVRCNLTITDAQEYDRVTQSPDAASKKFFAE